MAQRKFSKKAWKGVGVFFQKAIDMYAARGIALEIDTPFNPLEVDSRFSARGEAMSDAGHVEIVVYDWVHMRLALPEQATRIWGINPHSGKWNHHPERQALDNPDYQDDFFNSIAVDLDKINLRPWEVTLKRVTVEELDTQSLDDLMRQEKMGTQFVIADFDKREVAASIMNDDSTGETMANPEMHIDWLASKSDLAVYSALKNWEAEKARQLVAKGETPQMKLG